MPRLTSIFPEKTRKAFAALTLSFVFIGAASPQFADAARTRARTSQNGKTPKAAKTYKAPKENPRYGAIVIDAETGIVLHDEHADRILHPASMTKIMTIYVAASLIESGKLKFDDEITISAKAATTPPCRLGLRAGSRIKVSDAILALVTKSANDIAVAVAEHIGGTEENFASMMNEHARNLGMSRTNFANASGLPNDAQVSTPRDMATLGRAMYYHFPDVYDMFGTKAFTYNRRLHPNHNRLMLSYPGMDGIKTGFINASGYNLTASAQPPGQRRLVGVVFGGRSGGARNARMKALLDGAYAYLKKFGLPIAPIATLPPPLNDNAPIGKVATLTDSRLPTSSSQAKSATARISP